MTDAFFDELCQWAKAYPESMFRPVSVEERAWLHAERPGLQDRIAADMARHILTRLIALGKASDRSAGFATSDSDFDAD